MRATKLEFGGTQQDAPLTNCKPHRTENSHTLLSISWVTIIGKAKLPVRCSITKRPRDPPPFRELSKRKQPKSPKCGILTSTPCSKYCLLVVVFDRLSWDTSRIVRIVILLRAYHFFQHDWAELQHLWRDLMGWVPSYTQLSVSAE